MIYEPFFFLAVGEWGAKFKAQGGDGNGKNTVAPLYIITPMVVVVVVVVYRLTLTKSPLKVSQTAFVSPCKWGYQKANKMRRGGGARADHQPLEEEKKAEAKRRKNLRLFFSSSDGEKK